MSIRPIKINIDDNRQFFRAALLVDRDEFLRDVEQIRIDADLTEFIPHWVREPCPVSEYELFTPSKGQAGAFSKNWYSLSQFMLKRHKVSRSYEGVILSAIFCNEVTASDLDTSPYFLDFREDHYHDRPTYLEPYEIAIVVNTETVGTELVKKLNEFKKTVPLPGTKVDPSRDRTWYWRRKSGLSWNQIAKLAKANKETYIDDGSIIDAVGAYESAISKVSNPTLEPLGTYSVSYLPNT